MQIITLTNAKTITLTGRVNVIVLAQIGEFWTQILTVLGAPKGPILSIVYEVRKPICSAHMFSTTICLVCLLCMCFWFVCLLSCWSKVFLNKQYVVDLCFMHVDTVLCFNCFFKIWNVLI